MPSTLSVPVAIPPPPAQLALIALQVASILSSDTVTSATARIASSLVGPNCVGHERPTTAFFQSIGDKQTYIGVPGADDLLVADAKFIADHVARATSLDSPFHDDLRHPRPDLVDAVKFECAFAHDPDAFHADRLRRLAMWESLAASLSTAHKALQPPMSPQALYLLKAGASYPLIEAARIAIGWPDELMVPKRCMGFPTVGDYPDSGIFRTIERPATRAYSSLASATHNRYMVRFLRNQWRTASPEQRKALRIVTSKTHDEVAAGLCFGGFSINEMSNILCGDADDPSCFHAMHRFGVIQGVESDGVTPKVRVCDNARTSLTNECFGSHETIAIEDPSFPILTASLFAEFYPADKLPQLVHSTDDVKSAYRVIASLDPGSTVVAIYDTSVDDVRFFVLPGHNFGLAAAVISFNRLSQLIAAVARRCFGVPCGAYFDDYDCTEPAWAAPSGKLVLRRLHEWFGVPLADGTKDVPPRPVNAFLGVISDFSRFAQGVVVLRSKPSRVAKLLTQAQQFLDSGMPAGAAQHFLGKCEFLQFSATAGRLGRAAIGILRRWDNERRHSRAPKDENLPEVAREALAFIIFLLWRLPPRTFHLRDTRPKRKPIVLYTDGMYEQKAATPARIGVAAFDSELPEDERWWHISAAVPPSVIGRWKVRTQYIGPIEVLAPLVALLSCPERFRDRDIILFIDNTGALFGIGKGDCREADCARMIHLFHCLCTALNVRVWCEYVASGANLADLPSRDDLELLKSMGSRGIEADKIRFPDLSLSLTESFQKIMDEFSPSMSTSFKRHRLQIEEAIKDTSQPPPKRRR
jgi:hypothetical protein